MKNFRQFMAVPVMALCALLTFSACNDDPSACEGGGYPETMLSVGTPTISRDGVYLPVDAPNAYQIHYAILKKTTAEENPIALDASGDGIPVPEEKDYKTVAAFELKDGQLFIPYSEFPQFDTYYIYTYASNPKSQTEPKMITLEYTDKSLAKLLTFEVKNVTEFSLDVSVTKAELCETYVVTVLRQSVYNEASFISSAQMSIAPSESQKQYGKQAYVVNSFSATLPETRLAKGTKYDSDECEGITLARLNDKGLPDKYVVAAYAIDTYGHGSVYVGEPFELPAATYGNDPQVEITTTTTFTKLNASYKALSDNCSKIIYGVMEAIDNKANRDEAFWDPSNEANIVAFLKTIPSPSIVAYSKKPYSCELPISGEPGKKLVTYAAGISPDGKISAISYKVATCQLPDLSQGTAEVSALTFKEATNEQTGPYLSWNVAYSNNTTKVRFLVAEEEMFGSAIATDQDLAWTMSTNESTDGYGWWIEKSVAELKAAGNVYKTRALPFYDRAYVIRAIAQDTFGNWGAIKTAPNAKTLAATVVDKSIDFSLGKGEVTMTISKMELAPDSDPQYPTSAATFSVAKGANTTDGYIIKISDDLMFPTYESFTYANLFKACQKRFDKESAQTWPSINKLEFGKDYSPEPSVFSNPNRYGTSAWVIVTKDTDGNYKIAAACLAGQKTPLYPVVSSN